MTYENMFYNHIGTCKKYFLKVLKIVGILIHELTILFLVYYLNIFSNN